MDDHNELYRERLRKLEDLKNLGIEPYGGAFEEDGLIAALLEGFAEGKKVRIAGRVSAIRFHGKSAFGNIKDRTGSLQFYVKKDAVSDLDFKVFELLDIGDFAGFTGEFFITKAGEKTLKVTHLVLLSKALMPPPEKWHGLKDVETRYRQRYLDLIANEDAQKIFITRSRIVSEIRRFLDERGYLEVETPMMHPIPGGAAGKPFKTHHEALDRDLYLRVAPELYLKRLLVGGLDRVYELNKSFRNEGISTRHNPEFTMLEVYTAYSDVEGVMKLTEEIIKRAAHKVWGKLSVEWQGQSLDFNRWEKLSFAALMEETFGIRPSDEMGKWLEKLKKKGVAIEGKDLSRSQLIKIVGDLLEPAKRNHPVFVTDYFTELCPLAKKQKKDPGLSERFELFIGGMEVANGYSELNDPLDQRRRLEEELEGLSAEEAAGKLDEDFVRALEHGMPPAGGLGIGIDRLIMILTQQASIREVILFPQLKS